MGDLNRWRALDRAKCPSLRNRLAQERVDAIRSASQALHMRVAKEAVMQNFNLAKRRRFTDAARQAALAARLAKRAEPDQFGIPELFIVKSGDHAFAWELRRFGGVLLQRGEQAFATLLEAKAAGAEALAALCAQADLPIFRRELRSKAVPPLGTPT